ncbi:MAG TPA: bifunctional diguanylate cyclase/phosphodiesterase [Actinomycetales bacterium]|nr:bifunctional diguanylate cyclase/phosphodiesterase [Actinomycetales bacterium]
MGGELSLVGVLLVAGLLVGELGLIPVPGHEDDGAEVRMSTPFTVALVLTGPFLLLLVLHAVAGLLADLRSRRTLDRMGLTVLRSVLALSAGRLVFCALTGVPFTGGYEPIGAGQVPAALAAGGAFLTLWLLTTALVRSRATNRPWTAVFRSHVAGTVEASVVLMSIGPLLVVVAGVNPWLLPLLVLPVLAVRRSAALAAQHHAQSLHDALTGLSNRADFFSRTRHALVRAEGAGAPLAVLMVDLDHFKDINDTLGHQVGDELIQQVARRIADAVADDDGACVARLGGDEFAVLLDGHDRASAVARASEALDAVSCPLQIAGTRLSVQASIGVAVAAPGMTVSTIMKRADIALYEAKRERARWSVFDPASITGTPERLSLLADLREAVQERRLSVVFQPQVTVADGAVVGAEALARWHHPVRGPIQPEEFIWLAESAGLISQITDQVLDASLEALHDWNAAGLSAHVSVNLSARQLSDLNLPDRLAASLQRHRVDPHQLTIEVTESSIMGDPRRAAQILTALRDLGIRVAIDDFGTGYSSLVYLRSLDLDEIKIDRSFVRTLCTDANDVVLVRSIIELGHNLGLSVVAEGVEDSNQFVHLRDLGCDVVQGYHVGRPMDSTDVLQWFQSERTLQHGLPHRRVRVTPVAALPGLLDGCETLAG